MQSPAFAAIVSSLLLAAACGGGHKPAESAADTASLDTGSSASAKDAPADGGPTPDNPLSSPKQAAASRAGTAPGIASAGDNAHPLPSAVGTIDGKPFSPKLAHVMAKAQKDGRVLLRLDERVDCAASADAKADDAVLTVLVPWEDGYKIDLSALKRATKKSPGEIGFSRVNAAGKKELSTTFKPSGRLQIIRAPAGKDATGKLKIDLQSGDYMLAGDLDIQVCVAPK